MGVHKKARPNFRLLFCLWHWLSSGLCVSGCGVAPARTTGLCLASSVGRVEIGWVCGARTNSGTFEPEAHPPLAENQGAIR